jgi:hypothetical protein
MDPHCVLYNISCLWLRVLENIFHCILDVINKLEAQIQGVGGFALKTKNGDWC